MATRTISAKELVADFRAGMSDAALMEKYQLSERSLTAIFKKLLDGGALKVEELKNRYGSQGKIVRQTPVEKSVPQPKVAPETKEGPALSRASKKALPVEAIKQEQPAKRKEDTEKPIGTTWKCPACGTSQNQEDAICSNCHVLVAKVQAETANQTDATSSKETIERTPKEAISTILRRVFENFDHLRTWTNGKFSRSPNKRQLLAILSALCVLLIVILIWTWFRGGTQERMSQIPETREKQELKGKQTKMTADQGVRKDQRTRVKKERKSKEDQPSKPYQEGKNTEATKLAEESLATAEKTFGPDSANVAISLNNLAEQHRSQGEYAKAEPLYKRSLAIREKELGPDHPDVAVSLNNLARLYRSQGKYAEAEPLCKRSLEICERKLGPDHLYVATVLDNQARLYCDQGKYSEAVLPVRRFLAIIEKEYGPLNPKVVRSLYNLAEIYKQLENVEEAFKCEERARKIESLQVELDTRESKQRRQAEARQEEQRLKKEARKGQRETQGAMQERQTNREPKPKQKADGGKDLLTRIRATIISDVKIFQENWQREEISRPAYQHAGQKYLGFAEALRQDAPQYSEVADKLQKAGLHCLETGGGDAFAALKASNKALAAIRDAMQLINRELGLAN